MNGFQVFLEKTETGELVEASLLDQVTDRHLKQWRDTF